MNPNVMRTKHQQHKQSEGCGSQGGGSSGGGIHGCREGVHLCLGVGVATSRPPSIGRGQEPQDPLRPPPPQKMADYNSKTVLKIRQYRALMNGIECRRMR
jgi:hypothetical protein